MATGKLLQLDIWFWFVRGTVFGFASITKPSESCNRDSRVYFCYLLGHNDKPQAEK